MLKYNVNINDVYEDLERLDVIDIDLSDYAGNDGTETGQVYTTITVSDPWRVGVGDLITAKMLRTVDDQDNERDGHFTDSYKVTSVSDDGLSFTVPHGRRYELDGRSADIYAVTGEDGTQTYYIEIRFNQLHFFRESDAITLYITDHNGEEIPAQCDFVDVMAVRHEYDSDNQDDKMLMNMLTGNTENGEYFNIDLSRFTITRDQFMFEPYGYNDHVLDLYVQKTARSVQLPLSVKFATDMYQDGNREAFAQRLLDSSINSIRENEKDVYYPCSVDNEGKAADVIKLIKFNLHMRKRSKEGWNVETGAGWNTIYSNPYGNGNQEYQSDLLCHLGFTNNDVRFQKNTLRHTFIRLLFFDSPNPATQTLLAESTVFYNAPLAFARYAKYYTEDADNYVAWDDNGEPPTQLNENGEPPTQLNGIRVTREYFPDSQKQYDFPYIDERRLGAQFVTGDRETEWSSDGFYLYLWHDIGNTDTETDNTLYMRVELNHAGYGRIVPFMYPYDNGRVKTMDEILKDFRDVKLEEGETYDGEPYDIETYMDYAHIRIKYEKATDGRCVYYLDTSKYGAGMYQNGTLYINLYEARIKEENTNEENTEEGGD